MAQGNGMNLEEIERALREVGVPIGPDLDAAAAIRTLAGTPPHPLDPGDPGVPAGGGRLPVEVGRARHLGG